VQSHPATTASDQPWYQHVWNTVKSINDAMPSLDDPATNRSMTHALTMGFDEDVAAFPGALIMHYRTGMPIGEAWEKLKGQLQADRHALEQQHPVKSAVGSLVGTGANALLTGNLFSGAKGLLPLAGDVAAGSTLGGITSFGLSEGDTQQRLDDARKGAEWGGALTAAMPYVGRLIGGIYRSLRPAAQVDVKAGQTMGEMVKGPPPTFEQAPIENFPLGTGGATNDPRLAAAERRANTMDDAAAVARREEQQRAITETATTPQPSRAVTLSPTGRPAVPQLASRAMNPAQASGRLQGALQRAWQVFKQEEHRLWDHPLLRSLVDMPAIKGAVGNFGSKMPLRFRRAIENHAGLRGILEDLSNMPNSTTLADLNDIRSEILEISRKDPDGMIRKIAGDLASGLLKAIDSNPALRTNPAVKAAYGEARAFTKKMWDTIGHQRYQNIIKQGSDPAVSGRSLFGFDPQSAGERGTGINAITNALDDIRTKWLQLARSGFSPNVAQAAQRELGQSAVDYIINTMITPIAESQTGAEARHLNKLVQWIDRNQGWLASSRILAPQQIDLLRAIRDSAAMGARVANLRGGTGSETFERLMGGSNPQIINLFSTALNKHLFVISGGLIGHMIESTTGLGVGAILGMSAEGIGQSLLHRMYEMPTEALRARLIEAAGNPDIAQDLLKKASDFKNLSEATRRWLQALGAETGAHVEHGLSQ
jgi:hypothetical protein